MATYQDFLDAANKSNILGQFSSYDLDLAQKYPEFGLGMVTLKNNYAKATTAEQRAMYNTMANELRTQYGNYTADTAGLGYIPGGLSPGSFQEDSRYDQALDDLLNYGDFTWSTPAPDYNSKYDDILAGLVQDANNYPDFSYDVETDPLYSQYRKQYLREGDRATRDALAKVAASNGGQVSTAAAAAASQAGDYYAAQLNDKIPELQQIAYGKYLDDYNRILSNLQATQSQEQLDYNKYLNAYQQWFNERNQAYQQYLDKYGMLQSNLGALENDRTFDYNQLLDQIGFNQNRNEWNQALADAAKEDARLQVDAILQAGGIPPENLTAASGYDQAYIDALRQYYAAKAGIGSYSGGGTGSSGGSGSSGGRGGGNSGGGGSKSSNKNSSSSSEMYDRLFVDAKKSGNAKSYISEYYKQYGFESPSGLYDNYQSWNSYADSALDSHYLAFTNGLIGTLRSGKQDAALRQIEGRWASLNAYQRTGIQNILANFGLRYEG